MAAMPSLKIDNARYVVTVDPQRRIIQDGSILIEDGRITPRGQGGRAGRRARRPRDRRPPPRRHARASSTATCTSATPTPCAASSPTTPAARCNHVFKLQMAMTEEEEYATHPARPRRAAEERHGVLRRPGQHQVPRRLPAGLRGRRHPRDHGRVRDRPARRPFPLPRYAAERGGRPHAPRSSRSGTAGSTAALRGVGHAVLAGDVQRRPAARAQAAWPTSTGRRSRCTTTAGPRRAQDYQSRHGSAQPDAVSRVARRARTERRAGPRARHRRRRDRLPWRAPAPRWRCARSPRPRAGAASASTAACPSCWPRA